MYEWDPWEKQIKRAEKSAFWYGFAMGTVCIAVPISVFFLTLTFMGVLDRL